MRTSGRRVVGAWGQVLLIVALLPVAAGAQDDVAADRLNLREAMSQRGGKPDDGQDDEEVKIVDNSFLVEEAYNQEQGVVQHIFNIVPSWDRVDRRTSSSNVDILFTQEWPIFSQKHQFSYAIPVTYSAESVDGQLTQSQGFGDIALNYRYQVWNGENRTLAFAPRFSVLLPAGEAASGLGLGKVGYQVNLPFSKEFERGVCHFNAGYTSNPGVTAGVDPLLDFEGRTLNGYNLGGSLIHFLRPNFHLMLECVALWDENLEFTGDARQQFQLVLNPGFRWAPYTEKDTQWVLGVGVPVGLTPDATDVGLFLYMSFEHRFAKERKTD